jgi:beta-barrel assembly-enhancing protease
MEKEKKIEEREVAAAILLGPTRAHIIAIALIGKLHSLGYSRDAESKADVTGSDICAETGYNPWGLMWLFQDFQNADVRQIPPIAQGYRHLKSTFETIRPLFQSSVATQNLQLHSACRKAPLRFSCAQTPKRENNQVLCGRKELLYRSCGA